MSVVQETMASPGSSYAPYRRFGDELKRRVLTCGLEHMEVLTRCGVSQGHWSRLTRGQSKPRPELIGRISKTLQWPADEIVELLGDGETQDGPQIAPEYDVSFQARVVLDLMSRRDERDQQGIMALVVGFDGMSDNEKRRFLNELLFASVNGPANGPTSG